VIERIDDHPITHIEELLPWKIASAPEFNLHEGCVSDKRAGFLPNIAALIE
jgi:hypothetical protein